MARIASAPPMRPGAPTVFSSNPAKPKRLHRRRLRVSGAFVRIPPFPFLSDPNGQRGDSRAARVPDRRRVIHEPVSVTDPVPYGPFRKSMRDFSPIWCTPISVFALDGFTPERMEKQCQKLPELAEIWSRKDRTNFQNVERANAGCALSGMKGMPDRCNWYVEGKTGHTAPSPDPKEIKDAWFAASKSFPPFKTNRGVLPFCGMTGNRGMRRLWEKCFPGSLPKRMIPWPDVEPMRRGYGRFLMTVVVLCHNKWEWTQRCLAALRRHTPPGSYELIVADNGSTDGTPQHLEETLSGWSGARTVRFAGKPGFVEGEQPVRTDRRRGVPVFSQQRCRSPVRMDRTLLRTMERDRTVGAPDAG